MVSDKGNSLRARYPTHLVNACYLILQSLSAYLSFDERWFRLNLGIGAHYFVFEDIKNG
jgi:hypothetical protein